MQKKSWLLPEGVVELTGASARQLESIRRTLLDLYQTWGYALIFPPLLEYLDNLIAGGDEELALQTFKLTDQLSGRMLGIRADITPQVARHDAYHNQGQVNRLCYAGSVLHTRPNHILANRSLIQAGAELYGHKGNASDLEILELLINSLPMCEAQPNRKDWTITLGDAGITRSILAEINLSDESRPVLMKALKTRSETDIVEAGSTYDLTSKQVDQLIHLSQLCGNHQILKSLESTNDERCENLQSLYDTCQQQYPNIHWFFDFSYVNNYAYETGVTFHATHAKGAEPLARGGRYDQLSQLYGANRPAVGFSCDLLAIAKHTNTLALPFGQTILAPNPAYLAKDECAQALREKATELRSQGYVVTNVVTEKSLESLDSSIQEKYDGSLVFRGSEWIVKPH